MAYDASSFKVLSDFESIRNSPGMYIGSTSTPTHLIEEALDNSLDECLAGYANIIIVEIDTKNYCFSVTDNGRGIPTEEDIPITISTVLNSGSKFKGSRDSYKICSGRHGVGLVAINVLSQFFQIETVRNKVYNVYTFKNFNLVKKFSKEINDSDKTFSTKISFIPDSKIFETLHPEIEHIRQRLLISSINLENCVFVLTIDGNEEIIKLSPNDYFNDYCLSLSDREISNVIDINVRSKKIIGNSNSIDEYLDVKLCYSLDGPITPKITGSINLLPIDNGTHVKILQNILKDLFSNYRKSNKFIYQDQDVMCGLRAHINMSLVEPEFSGQAKTQLINRISYLKKLFGKFKKQLESYFLKNNDQLELITDRFISYRKKIESKKVRSISHKRSSTRYTKLKDCRSKNGELFIVEGDSAAGSLKQCRDSNIHAIMPIRGKIPNVAIKERNIIKNQEVKEIISATGTGIEPEFDISHLRYDKVIICSDSDPDGNHITCLLIALFGFLMPKIIEHGKLFICKTPLFAISKDKIFIPLWTQKEIGNARKGKHSNNIIRFKGLGEFSPWQIKKCVFDVKTRKLIQVKMTKDLSQILSLLRSAEAKRNLLDEQYEKHKSK